MEATCFKIGYGYVEKFTDLSLFIQKMYGRQSYTNVILYN